MRFGAAGRAVSPGGYNAGILCRPGSAGGGAAAGIAELGTATGYGGASGFSFAGQDTTGADFLSVQLSGWQNWSALPTVTDNKGNTWTRSASIGVGASYSVIFTCVPTSVGADHVVTVAGVNLYGSGVLRWFSGVRQTDTIEATRSTNNTRTDTFTTANDGDLILTCSGAGANSTNYDPGDLTTPASGYSPVKVLSNPTGSTSSFGITTGAGIKATAGSVTTTYTGGDSGGTATAIIRKA